MADEIEPNIPNVASNGLTKSPHNGDTDYLSQQQQQLSSSNQTTNQPNQQQLIFDDVCLTNKERSSTPSSYSSQDVGLSGSSTPLGTPFHASNESLIKDLLGSGISVGDDDSDDHHHHHHHHLHSGHHHIGASSSSSSDVRHNEMTDGFLLDLKALEANYEAKMSTVIEEKTDLEKQVIDLKEKLFRQEEEFKRTVEDIKLTFNTRLDKCTKERDLSRKDLESMVVKYAKSERDVIVCKKAKDEAEKKMREAIKEKETLASKVKSLTCDKSSMMKSIDSKLTENILLQKEIEKIREELKDRDLKWKQAQSKVKAEIDDHHETCKKLGSALALIEDLQNKLKASSPSYSESSTLTSPEDRSSRSNSRLGMISDSNDVIESNISIPLTLRTSTSTHSLREMGRESNDTKSELAIGTEEKVDETKPELRGLKDKLISLEAENHSLTRKVQALERERLDHEEVVFKLKESLNKLNGEILECNIKLKDMEELQVNLQRQKDIVESAKNELARVSELNTELTTEMESCRHKEGELLEFTERLTAKSVLLQAEHNTLEEKYTSLLEDFNVIKKRLQELETENSKLNETLTKERGDHEKEITLMARKVAEKMELVNKFKTRVEEIENENKVMKKRHLNSVRELNKELLIMKKHMETCESEHQSSNHRRDNGNANSDSISNSSRSSSSSNDLSTAKATQPPTITPSSSSTINSRNDIKSLVSTSGPGNQSLASTTGTNNTGSASYDGESSTINKSTSGDVTDILPNVDKSMLINKIYRLQKTIAKKQEKIDFLEEHNHQLLSEMKKKTKLIQNYILREEAGALSTNRMDENKKQLAKHGSTVMSSLYKSYPTDSAMTLNLSLEINRRLQAVLEDTILKNITLKENLNTLGEEIARLMQQKTSSGTSTKPLST
ncbi:coiled-coil domain-containing protein 186-like [Panonychus citri]|uniref:coiled-coil domain-containing protein 186-like n=1 Tax=Panonychus citri TaxID=50023 RepID=UPI002307614C|nr:coiled-coil domain-containing protein 186-like [Panonychus citri]